MIQILRENPLLLLFTVAGIGYLVGQIRIGGLSLGVAAVLFVGLAFGAIDPDLKLPEFTYLLGLVVFVYTIGISSGPGFMASLRRKGLRDNLLVVGVLVFAAALTYALHIALGLRATVSAGLFAGSLTNTPALAGLLDYIKGAVPEPIREQLLTEPVIGYSIAYPVGVIGVIAAMVLGQRIWKIDYPAEAVKLREFGIGSQHIINRTVRITRPDVANEPVETLANQHWNIIFGRIHHDGQLAIAGAGTRFVVGDLVSLIGTPDSISAATAYLGEPGPAPLDRDSTIIENRLVFVSNPGIAGLRLADIALPHRFGALVTRVRRGDMELLPHGDTVLELGDRVRVVAPRDRMDATCAFFGDSYRAVSEIDVLTFSFGLMLGLLVGLIPIPLPGGMTFKLGFAGGPLVVALILGTLERTGPLVWNIPYSANLTLRQIGLILFLAGIGTRSGYAFITTLASGGGIQIFLAGAIITCISAMVLLWAGYRRLGIPMSLLIGMLAGLQTQPAALAFALEQTENELPGIGYATVYPVAMMAKIVLAQLLLTLLL